MQHLWGTSEVVYKCDQFMLVRGQATGGCGASSLHLHEFHENTVLVLSGCLRVDVYKEAEPLASICTRVLFPGDRVEVPAKAPHIISFSEQPCEFLEWYVPIAGRAATLDDIVRLAEGVKAFA